jgi:prephenate dehydrogenase
MAQQSLGIIGVGAFGAFMLPHIARHFHTVIYDVADVAALAEKHGVKAVDLQSAGVCDIVVVAVPVQKLEAVLQQIASYVKQGALVIDVASVKIKPTEMMLRILPEHVSIVGTHPLFGPQSGKHGIEGLNIAVCNVRGDRAACVSAFLRDKLILNVVETSAEDHDRQLAYVQGLTHLLAKVVVALDLPDFKLTTKTYDLLEEMVAMVRYDSDELFKAIERENPFTVEAKKSFFAAARKLEETLENNDKK